jgi:UDP-N-acetylmuramoyl-tripeptide--D-alanyl-D-alanine ligase
MIRDLATLAKVTGGELHGSNVAFGEVSSDTRQLAPGSLFVALRGEYHDAHQFVPEAATRQAAGALVSRVVTTRLPQVVVPDVLAALSAYAHAWRRAFTGPVVGLTGSNGKTTVKEMIGAILGSIGPCLVTRGNLNNHIGVPLTLCRLDPAQRFAVIEMGANHQREIAALTAIAAPDVGLVTNAGPAHLEGFGGLDGVAKGKGELFEALGSGQTAVINADDAFADYWRGLAGRAGRVLTFGLQAAADFRGSGVGSRVTDAGFETTFTLDSPLGRREIRIHLAGSHNVINALGASAAAYAAGADLAAIENGLGSMRPVAGRLELKAAVHGARLIDDSYNANPGSLRAGIVALASIPGEHWLVLGEMAELGPGTSALHREIGAFARSSGVQRLLAVGAEARHAVESFGPGASWFANVDELIATARDELYPGVTVLIKGSRVNRLERVATALCSGHDGTGNTGGTH